MSNFDWETKTIEAPIYIWFEDLPDSFKAKNEKGEYLIQEIVVKFEQWHNKGEIHLYPEEENSKISFHGSLPQNRFNYRGPTEIYPYDSYFIDINFTFPNLVLITKDNIFTKPEITATGFNVKEEEGSGGKPFTLTESEDKEKMYLNFKVYLHRNSSSINLIMQVLTICFLLVGSMPLIKPEKMENRLSICLSLFLFSVSFTFTVSLPSLNRATLAESLTFILLTGAGLYSVISVIERALFEAIPKIKNLRFLLEGLVVLYLINSLRDVMNGLLTPDLSILYPWIFLPSGLMLSLSLALVYCYVIEISVYLINIIWKKIDKTKINEGTPPIKFLKKS